MVASDVDGMMIVNGAAVLPGRYLTLNPQLSIPFDRARCVCVFVRVGFCRWWR